MSSGYKFGRICSRRVQWMEKIERVVLDPSKRIHRNKFDEHGEETLDSIPLESTIQNIIVSVVAKNK